MSEARQVVLEILAKNAEMDITAISEDSAIEDLGIDSLDFNLMFFDLEDALGMDIPEMELKDLKTVGDILRIVDSHAGADSGSPVQ